MSTSLGLSQIGQIAIPVKDVAAATRFYRTALGMKCVSEMAEMSFFDCDGMRLMLARPEGLEPGYRSGVIYFTVENIYTAANTLVSRGVQFISKPHVAARTPDHEVWFAFFKDIDGNMLALMSEIHKVWEEIE